MRNIYDHVELRNMFMCHRSEGWWAHEILEVMAAVGIKAGSGRVRVVVRG